jgi:hypothetical protein
VRIASNADVLELKEVIREKTGVPEGMQRLLSGRKQLRDEGTLRAYKVEEGCTVHLLLRLLGG